MDAMSRFLYWTIVLGAEPTSFRASDPGELLPTLAQLRRKHPEAQLRWFQRGRLWLSPDEAKAALVRERDATRGRPATWRPGGKHEDPRQKYKDAKKAKWTKFKSAIRERSEARRARDDERGSGPRPERPRETRDPRAPADRPPRADWRRRDTGDRPPRADWRPRDTGDRPPRADWRPRDTGDRPPRAGWSPRDTGDRPPRKPASDRER
jgi:hypothetical protein